MVDDGLEVMGSLAVIVLVKLDCSVDEDSNLCDRVGWGVTLNFLGKWLVRRSKWFLSRNL